MTADRARWVLAFDGSCGACAGIADAVSAAAGDRLDVLALQNPAVTDWRRLALGAAADWKPALLAVSDDGLVRAWTGPALAWRLVGRLGAGGALRVVRTIGGLRAMNARGEVRRPGDVAPLRRLSRSRFARELGLGALTVIQIAVTGAAPAAADTVGGWERTVEGSLPTTLPGLAALPEIYRRVAYPSLTPEQKSAAWTAHLAGSATGAGDDQRAAFGRAQAFAADPVNFRDPDLDIVESIADEMTAAFGREQATLIIATLGPPDDVPPGDLPEAVTCACSVASDYCSGSRRCRQSLQNCTRTTGCGSFYSYQCDGLCA